MATYYLRFEGVNLVHFVADSKDLNTIRGGSLVLLDAALDLSKLAGLSPVSTGASAGWYSFEAANEDEARLRLNQVRERLREGPLEHATVVLDAIETTTGNFERDREALLALNRYRQMQSASVVYPKDRSSSPYVCDIDGVRPRAVPVRHPDGVQWLLLSHSVALRKEYGHTQKRRFYERVNLGGRRRLVLPEFAQSFDDIANGPDEGNLHRKLAVIYIDGNKFGSVQAGCKSAKESRQWDEYIQDRRWDWLHDHLEETINDPRWRLADKGPYRMEILLWGGDDIIVVVPAWQGWSTLEGFFTKMGNLNFKGDKKTHSAGLVFCHQKTSIHTITPLAEKLCKEAKDACKREDDALSYQVLESFDTLGSESEFEVQREKMTPLRSSLVLRADTLRLLREGMQGVQRFIPRRKLHEVVRLYLQRKNEASKRAGELDKLMGDLADGWEQLRTLWEPKDGLPDPVLWVHLNELWDYLPESQA